MTTPVTDKQKKKYLNGDCVSFAKAYRLLHCQVKLATIEDQYGDPFHAVCVDGNKIVDVTGIWKNKKKYFKNLRDIYTEICSYVPSYCRGKMTISFDENNFIDLIPAEPDAIEEAKQVLGACDHQDGHSIDFEFEDHQDAEKFAQELNQDIITSSVPLKVVSLNYLVKTPQGSIHGGQYADTQKSAAHQTVQHIVSRIERPIPRLPAFQQLSKKKVIIIVGTIMGNKTFHGPFDDEEHADQWASLHIKNQSYEIVPLESR